MTKIALASSEMCEWKSGFSALWTEFHSSISLVAGEIFVSENQKNKSFLKFSHAISEITITDHHLPKQVSIVEF